MMAEFMARCPQVMLQLEATNRRVDVLNEGIDLAIRVRSRPLEDSGLAHRVLSERRQCLVASPAMIEALGQPTNPADLRAWPCLGFGGPEQSFRWALTGPDGASFTQQFEPRYITRDLPALQTAARAGVGVVQLPLLMVRADLENGTLVQLLPGWQPLPEAVHIVFPSRRGLLPAVRALIEHLADAYRALGER